MRLFGDDTDPETERLMLELLRRMTPAQRLAKAMSLTSSTHAVALAALRLAHPDDSERTLKIRLAARMWGRELVEKAFGELPG